ncbi:MAG: alpha/beta fold hydrolase [Marinifilaceae bacterium]|jgi:pimeloyl-ACP methyl ester carboxylesterase|nr:alpha/beta fold hydrolase [Marinifilaceae bacterium]
MNNIYYRSFGKGETVIILHGLFGCSDNWISIAKKISKNYRVIIPDFRNHGASSNLPSHTYNDLETDIINLISDLNIQKTSIIGHSMGGKTTMGLLYKIPKIINKAIIIDIAPKDYLLNINKLENNKHSMFLKKCKNIDIVNKNTSELINELKHLDNDDIQLILKNIKRGKPNKWKLNIDVLEDNLSEISSNNIYLRDSSTKEVHFVKGEQSNYIKESDINSIKKYFPNSSIHVIPNSGHKIHIDNPENLFSTINQILNTMN